MYRPDIKVLDCSVRDGGLINKWQFSDDLVRATYVACCQAGVDYVELGYKASAGLFDPAEYGKWRFCDDGEVERLLEGVQRSAKLSCMCDIGRVQEDDIHPCEQSPFDMLRIASYVKDIDKAIALASLALERGYETTVNIMAVSTNLEKDIDEALEQLSESDIPCVYVVDSYGSMYCEDITFLVSKYKAALPDKTIGVHCHNNRQLAFGNTIQAIIDDANMLDGSAFGIGRGAGNCPLELLLSFLKNPKFSVRPILKLIEEHYLPLSRELEWGYVIPYAVTGMLNEHPRVAIAQRHTPECDQYLDFYDRLTMPEVIE